MTTGNCLTEKNNFILNTICVTCSFILIDVVLNEILYLYQRKIYEIIILFHNQTKLDTIQITHYT